MDFNLQRSYSIPPYQNRLLKLLISAVFHIFCLVWNFFRKCTRQKKRGYYVSIYYHGVCPELRIRFAKQLSVLTKLTRPIPANFKGGKDSSKPLCIVSFCDGFQCFLENALPELIKYNIPATVFIPSNYIGLHPEWDSDNKYKSTCNNQKVMSAEQLKRLPHDSIRIGSHSMSHTKLTLLEYNKAKQELFQSIHDLETITEYDVKFFFFPYGVCNDLLLKLAHDAGYERVFTGIPKLSSTLDEEFEIGSISVDPMDWHLEFKLKLLGAYRWLPVAISAKHKLSNFFKKSFLLNWFGRKSS